MILVVGCSVFKVMSQMLLNKTEVPMEEQPVEPNN